MIHKKGSTYWLIRRVPKQFSDVESRKFVKQSLKTDSLKDAQRKADSVWASLCAGWEAKQAGDHKLSEHLFITAKRDAQRMGFAYKRPNEIADLPVADILERISAAAQGDDMANAALGMIPPPTLTVKAALSVFWEVSGDKVIGKTEDQIRRWKNPRKKSIGLFIDVVGDKDIATITRDDMLAFKDYLTERVASGEITANSANKEITHFCGVMRRVNEMKQLGLILPFEKLRLDVKSQRTKRSPFSRNWIETRILARGALDGLNHEARRVLLMMVNTGARPSELAGLMLKHVDLDGPIPTIEITPEGRALKNEHSERRIPLHGVSLDAATAAVEAAVNGGRDQLFPSYFGKDKVSDTVNKFMRENGLKENEGTTLYSLRHAFEDRMIEADVADRVRADLFGHAIQRERYGDGGGDEVRYRAVRSVSIHQP